MTSATTSLSFRHIFGINGNLQDNQICFVDDDTIMYIAGHNVVMYNKIERKQRFIYGSEGSEGISCYIASPGRRYAAMAEKTDRGAQINIYDLKSFRKRKNLINTGNASRDYVCMQFSEDNQILLALTGAPDWVLQCWNWSKAKVVASLSISDGYAMTKISFSPTDASIACVTGKDHVKFFRITDREVKLLNECHLEGHNFISHMWLRAPEDHLIAGTDAGDLLVFRSTEYVCHIKTTGTRYPIYSLLSLSHGFLIGTKQGNFLYYWNGLNERDDKAAPHKVANSFKLERTWQTELTQGSIISLAISPGEDCICATTSDNQILTMPGMSPNTIAADMVKYVTCSFHGPKSIVGMDVCYRKPLIVTCSRDNSLRIWNFQTMDLELNKHFPEEMLCCSFHPSGLHLAVGFGDKLRVFHVLVDELRSCLELPIKNCRECTFSSGGNLLAAANGNTINVFDFYSGDKVADLRGHNSKVRSMFWLDSGAQLLSCGQDGAVYLWDIDGCKRSGEFLHKGTLYTSAVCTNDTAFVVGSDRMLKELELPDLTLTKELDGGNLLMNMVALSAPKSVLFAGTGDPGKPGVIRAYAYPVTGDYLEYTCMTSPVTRLCLTPDDSFLIATDESGCVIIFELKDRSERFKAGAISDLTPISGEWVDEALVTRAELEDSNQAILELKTKVEELKLHNEYKLKLKEMNYSEKIKEETDKFSQELENAKSRFEILKEERADAEFEYVSRLKGMEEKHQHQLQEMETTYQTKIMEEVEKYEQLTRMRDSQLERLRDQRAMLISTHERYVEELSADFERKIDEDRQLRVQLDDEKAELLKELSEIHQQLEDDIDTEIDHLRYQYDDKLKTSRDSTLKYKGENGIMRKKFAVLQKEIDDQKEEIKTLFEKEKELHEQVKMLEKEVSVHKKEIKNRDNSISEKEKKIYELKKKNQELDKFKFVLDYKIRELKRQVEPRQNEIAGMKERIKVMDLELEKYHSKNATLDEMIGTLRSRIDAIQADIVAKRMRGTQLEHLISGFKSDVQRASTLIQSPLELQRAVEKLIAAYGSQETLKPRVDPDVEKEYSRHKQFLQKSMLQLKKSLHEEIVSHGNTNASLRKANMDLISDINIQRDKNKGLKQQIQADLGRLQHIIRNQQVKKLKGKLSALEASLEMGLASISREENPAADYQVVSVDDDNEHPLQMLDLNRQKIDLLRRELAELENKMMAQRAYSREVLPPMDGVGTTEGLTPELG